MWIYPDGFTHEDLPGWIYPSGFTHEDLPGWIYPGGFTREDLPRWIYPWVLRLEELGNASDGAPEVMAVPTGAPGHGQVLCSVDEVQTWLGAPQGSQVVAGVAAEHDEAPGNGNSPNGSCSAPVPAPPAPEAPQAHGMSAWSIPEWEQGQELGISARTAPGTNKPLAPKPPQVRAWEQSSAWNTCSGVQGLAPSGDTIPGSKLMLPELGTLPQLPGPGAG